MSKLSTLGWFAARPSFYPHLSALLVRKLTKADRFEAHEAEATRWAADRAVNLGDALRTTGIIAGFEQPAKLSDTLLEEARDRAARSKVPMGGPGDLDLIYRAILASKATRVVETGVAYGWSSLAALAALAQTGGRLVSVDMPYVGAGNEPFVGIVVPADLRSRWTLIRRPDRNGVKQAIARFGGEIDLCHYDSDKSYVGRMFAYPLLWRALRPGGVFISDDIQDNFGFRDFAARNGIEDFCVVECLGKYVAVARKPLGSLA